MGTLYNALVLILVVPIHYTRQRIVYIGVVVMNDERDERKGCAVWFYNCTINTTVLMVKKQ